MNLIRKTGLVTALGCVFAAISSWVYALFGGNSDLFSLVSCLCGAAVFLVAPYTIIPEQGKNPNSSDGNDRRVQVFTSGFYAITLLGLLVMSLPAITNSMDSTESNDALLMSGLIILAIAFSFSLLAHVASVAKSMILIPRS